MKSKTTAIWFALAASLLAFVWVVEKYLQPAAPVSENVLPGLRAAAVTEIQVIPAGALAIGASLTNSGWQLEPAQRGPARAATIQSLLTTLAGLAPASRIAGTELPARTNAAAEFGFANPRFILALTAGGQQWQLRIGNPTALGDQVYLQVVGSDAVLVTDAAWLALLPHSVDDWRDNALLPLAQDFDWIVITNGTKVIELHRDGTNQGWRITRPLPARADGDQLATALKQLHTARSARFVTDDPHADLAGYGLQPADLDVWLGQGTNLITALHAGKPTPENPDQFYARREGLASVVTVAREILAPWRGAFNDFRDPRVLPRLTAPVAEIEMTGADTFTLQRLSSNQWAVAGEKYPASRPAAQECIKAIDSLRIAEFVKDNNTPTDLQKYGLNPPAQQITLRAVPGDTNSTLARLSFGTVDTNRVYVKLDGENSVYALDRNTLGDLLVKEGWGFRERHIWHFATTNISRIILTQSGKTRQILHLGEGKWLPTADSAGTAAKFDMAAVDTAALYFSDLAVAGWVGHAVTTPETFGLDPANLSITFLLKTGEKYSVNFGLEINRSDIHTALASVNLDGETWVCVFPPLLFQYVLAGLTIPPDPR